MVILPRAFLHQREFADAVERVERELKDRVVRIRHTVDYDWSGEPAVYFRIVMPDSSMVRGKLVDATLPISNVIRTELRPQEQWGVYPYFTFRSQSGQDEMQEPDWA